MLLVIQITTLLAMIFLDAWWARGIVTVAFMIAAYKDYSTAIALVYDKGREDGETKGYSDAMEFKRILKDELGLFAQERPKRFPLEIFRRRKPVQGIMALAWYGLNFFDLVTREDDKWISVTRKGQEVKAEYWAPIPDQISIMPYMEDGDEIHSGDN